MQLGCRSVRLEGATMRAWAGALALQLGLPAPTWPRKTDHPSLRSRRVEPVAPTITALLLTDMPLTLRIQPYGHR